MIRYVYTFYSIALLSKIVDKEKELYTALFFNARFEDVFIRFRYLKLQISTSKNYEKYKYVECHTLKDLALLSSRES